MKTNRSRFASVASVASAPAIGTEQHYHISVDTVDKARLSTVEYIDFFRQSGIVTPTGIGKAALHMAETFEPGVFGIYAGKSMATIRKASSLSERGVKVLAWAWAIQTRARQLYDKEGNVKGAVVKPAVVGLNPQQAQGVSVPETPATSGQAASGQAASGQSTGQKLKNVNTLPVERVAIQMLVDLLDKGIANESWQEIADCRKMLSGFLA